MTPAPDCRLYLITPPALDPEAFAPVLAEALDAGDVACVQLRLKGPEGPPEDEAVIRAAGILGPVCRERDVAFLINDRADIAARVGADGVHIGQQDMDYATARRLVGRDAIVGVTCHDSRHLALVAAERGADYVAFGAFYPTGTKTPKTRADPELLRWWHSMVTVPAVAIGGITVANCGPLVEAGADFLAVVSGVWDYPEGPARAVVDFNVEIERALARRKSGDA